MTLHISCRKLKDLDTFSKSDPQVEVYMKDKDSGSWILAGKTEVVHSNLNPDFKKYIECEYIF